MQDLTGENIQLKVQLQRTQQSFKQEQIKREEILSKNKKLQDQHAAQRLQINELQTKLDALGSSEYIKANEYQQSVIHSLKVQNEDQQKKISLLQSELVKYDELKQDKELVQRIKAENEQLQTTIGKLKGLSPANSVYDSGIVSGKSVGKMNPKKFRSEMIK